MMEGRTRSAKDLGRLVRDGLGAVAPPCFAGKLRRVVGVAEAPVSCDRHGQALLQLVHRALAADANDHATRLQAGCHGAVREERLLGRELVPAGTERCSPEVLRIDGEASRKPLALRW